MTIRTTAGSTETLTYSMVMNFGANTTITRIESGTTFDDIVSVAIADSAAVLTLLNSYNVGDWTYNVIDGFYYCYNSTVSIIGFSFTVAHVITGFAVGTALDYLVDYEVSSMAIELETVSNEVPVNPITLPYGICPCVSDYEELVFSGETEDNIYQSDRTSYLFKKFVTADSYSLKLYKDGSSTGIDIDSDIAYNWGYGDLSRSTVVDASYSGFLIYWYRVFTIHGYGSYIIKGTYTINGTTYTYESHKFKLCAYNVCIARGTVKIESIQNGYTISDSIDFTGFNWYQSIRVYGKLTKMIPKLTQDNFINGSRVVTQIQDNILDSWELELMPLPTDIANYIAYSATMANSMIVSDYNMNPEVYSQLNLMANEISKFNSWTMNPDIRTTLKLVDRVQNRIKRNFQ